MIEMYKEGKEDIFDKMVKTAKILALNEPLTHGNCQMH